MNIYLLIHVRSLDRDVQSCGTHVGVDLCLSDERTNDQSTVKEHANLGTWTRASPVSVDTSREISGQLFTSMFDVGREILHCH